MFMPGIDCSVVGGVVDKVMDGGGIGASGASGLAGWEVEAAGLMAGVAQPNRRRNGNKQGAMRKVIRAAMITRFTKARIGENTMSRLLNRRWWLAESISLRLGFACLSDGRQGGLQGIGLSELLEIVGAFGGGQTVHG